MRNEIPIVVFSHLRWDWVYQRPQHLLSRIARHRPVVLVEEPIRHTGHAQSPIEVRFPCENVQVWQAHTDVEQPGFCSDQIAAMRPLLQARMAEANIESAIAWLYTPLALPLLDVLNPALVVYDCMDELSGFRGAPAELLDLERALFKRADLVFTGGRSLFEAKRKLHANCHCFPSSVDPQHFGKARDAGAEPAAQAALPRPRLGYYGVIDERIDLSLLAEVADQRPGWNIVMVGPRAKVEDADLPRRSNIHYLGQQTYESLPDFLRGWDVCLLPFALNDATRFISPTKTLEYMAAEKPIVGTPIRDVEEPYGHVVRIANSPAEFLAACESSLAQDDDERGRRVSAMRDILALTSWDRTVERMEALIESGLRERSADRGGRRPQQDGQAPAVFQPMVIIGAGPTGLSAAYHAGDEALLIEQNDRVGGWCRSLESNGFTFDYAGHIMFSNDAYVHELYEKLLGSNVHWQDREAWIYSKNVHTRYPFQGALYGLPAEAIKECIVGAVEARFGALKPAAPDLASGTGRVPAGDRQGGAHSTSACVLGDVKDCCGDGVLESTARLVASGNGRNGDVATPRHELRNGNGHGNGRNNGNGCSNGAERQTATEPHAGSPSENFEEFIYRVWGAGIAKHFAIPYNRKLWAVPLAEMETSWLGGRVPMPDLEEMIEGALRPVPRPMGPNARFGYPLRGGFQALMDGFLPYIGERLRLNSAITAVSPLRQTVTLNGREEIGYGALISTMPLPTLIRMMGAEAPARIRAAVAKLRHVSVRCVNLGIGREKLTDKHWIYYPEDTVFHRIFVQGNASPHCNPPGGFGLTCEITYSPSKPLPCEGQALVQRCIDDCVRVGLVRKDDPILTAVQCDLPHAYVVYDHARAQNVKVIREWLGRHGIVLAGRYSEWEYYNSDHAFIAGKKAVEAVRSGRVAV